MAQTGSKANKICLYCGVAEIKHVSKERHGVTVKCLVQIPMTVKPSMRCFKLTGVK